MSYPIKLFQKHKTYRNRYRKIRGRFTEEVDA